MQLSGAAATNFQVARRAWTNSRYWHWQNPPESPRRHRCLGFSRGQASTLVSPLHPSGLTGDPVDAMVIYRHSMQFVSLEALGAVCRQKQPHSRFITLHIVAANLSWPATRNRHGREHSVTSEGDRNSTEECILAMAVLLLLAGVYLGHRNDVLSWLGLVHNHSLYLADTGSQTESPCYSCDGSCFLLGNSARLPRQ